jgi:hypothetical protein
MTIDTALAMNLLGSLEEKGIVEADQDWLAGATTWTFPDGSCVRIEGDDYEVID